MFFSRLLIPATLALGVLAIPLDSSLEGHDDQPPASFKPCIEAENCEVYKEDDGYWSIRYVQGMEPGTDWYNEHVNTTVGIGPQKEESALDKRQECNSWNQPCTYIWVRPDRTLYGTLWPRTAVQVLWNKCYAFGCDVGDISQSTSWSNGGGPSTIPGQLRITPRGTFDPAFRWSLLVAIQDTLRDMTTSKVVRGSQSALAPITWTATMYTAPYRIHVARFNQGNMQGDLAINVAMQGGGSWGCAQVLSALNSVTSSLSPFVGGALGILSGLCG